MIFDKRPATLRFGPRSPYPEKGCFCCLKGANAKSKHFASFLKNPLTIDCITGRIIELSNYVRRYLSWIEGLTTNQYVGGSNPSRRTIYILCEPSGSFFVSESRMKEKIYQGFHLDDSEFSDTLASADKAKEDYDLLKPFSLEERDALASYDEDFLVRFTHGSNAIEGSTLSLDDTTLVLEGEFVPDKPGKEIFMAKGVADGYDYALQAAEQGLPLTENLVKDIHLRTALDNQPRTRGVYRTSAVYLRGSDVVPASPLRVRELMADLVYAYGESTMHPLLKIAAFHAMFENIHPFQDGNGRTGRTLMNYMLLQSGYIPIALKADAGGALAYSTALQAWQLDNEALAFASLIQSLLVEEYKRRTEAVCSTREATLEITGRFGTFEQE